MNAEGHSSALRYLMVRTTAFVTLTALSAASSGAAVSRLGGRAFDGVILSAGLGRHLPVETDGFSDRGGPLW